MNNLVNRRQMLRATAMAATGVLASPLLRFASAEDAKTRKLLFFTKSSGFEHSVIHRKKPDDLSFAENLMMDWGKQWGFEVTATKDGSVFTPDGLAPFDIIMFYTTGHLDEPGTDKQPPMPRDGKQNLLKHIASGKGFLGLHCASDTFHSEGDRVDPYIEMLGGEFVTHGSQQDAKIIAADHNFGPIKGLEDFTEKEEWYQLKNFAPDMHVILIQDTQSMKEQSYRDLKPYPETWARMHGKGRVFYSSMGHREEVWQSEIFQKVLRGGLDWAAGNATAELTPNFNEATPGAVDRARKSGPA